MIRNADFQPAWWLSGPHGQTVWASKCRRRPQLALQRERLELADGDFIDLDWTVNSTGPIVLVLTGLEGSSKSNYARGLLAQCLQRGWRGVVMHFRGCSEEPNRLPRSYNAGETGDVAEVVKHLQQREANIKLAVVGYSLGGNVLLKWLGEQGEKSSLQAAAAVSVPFLLESVTQCLRSGFSRIYQRSFLKSMFANYQRKFEQLSIAPPLAFDKLPQIQDFYDFDDRITAPLHGYDNARDYYQRGSCRQYLHQIKRPTLILHSLDDPFMASEIIPAENELSNSIVLELSQKGGHVGFIGGSLPWQAEYWLEQRIPEFLAGYLE